MSNSRHRVAVIIAAWNAESTIGRAVRSALDQREVAEVVVVNDGSSDQTVSAALAAAQGDMRFAVTSTEGNRGPAAARNIGIAASRSDYVAVLDADDFFLPDRFGAIFALSGWDAVADNIVFVPEDRAAAFDLARIENFGADPTRVTLTEFISGNISRPGRQRGELGFAKPVMSRRFLERHGLRYAETLRLGEDFALYARLIAAGGRFFTIRSCGYAAIERAASLSGQHRTEDLAALLAFDRWFEQSNELRPDERAALARHRSQLEHKVHHRTVLDIRSRSGAPAAILHMLRNPAALPRLALAIARDKRAGLKASGLKASGLSSSNPNASGKDYRYLL
ncbi:MAG: glycosyltransferase family 2 protein [Novosphingobium sp.]